MSWHHVWTMCALSYPMSVKYGLLNWCMCKDGEATLVSHNNLSSCPLQPDFMYASQSSVQGRRRGGRGW